MVDTSNADSPRKVALITGATRGIGKASALALARAGFHVVVTGRTLQEGQGKADDPINPIPLPGSIEQTVAEIRAAGGSASGVQLNIMDPASIDAAVDKVLADQGRIDVLLNNALFSGPPNRAPFLDIDRAGIGAVFDGCAFNHIHITQRVLPAMITQGHGRVLFMSSAASVSMPLAKPPTGGAGLLYSASKAAFNRISDFVHLEHYDDGVWSFLIHPAFTFTDTMQARYGGPPPQAAGYALFPVEATADVVAWMSTSPDAARYSGKPMISAPHFFAKEGIEPVAA